MSLYSAVLGKRCRRYALQMTSEAGVVGETEIGGAEVGQACRDLVEGSARFCHDFLRWLDTTAGQLTYPRLRVLEILHCQGPAKMKDLAGGVGMTARNLTTLADGLESEGLVRRVSHPSDRRAILLELTASGVAAAERTLEPRLAEISRLFEVLSEKEQDELERLLARLRTAMEAGPP